MLRHIAKFRGLPRLLLLFLVLLVTACGSGNVPNQESRNAQGTEAAAAPADLAVELRVLVLADDEQSSRGVIDQLNRAGVPFTRINLSDPARPRLTEHFLVRELDERLRGSFSGIVAEQAFPPQLSGAERTALADYRRTFDIRLVRTTPPEIAEPPAAAGAEANLGGTNARATYEGDVAGLTARVTDAGRTGSFGYLRDEFSFDGELAGSAYVALQVGPASASVSHTPLVTAPIPGVRATGSLVAQEMGNGLEDLVLGIEPDQWSAYWNVLAPGVMDWLNRGVNPAANRNYLSVHIDDVLLPNALWNTADNCEYGFHCPTPPGVETTVRMQPSDVSRLVEWQQRSGIKLDMAQNGAGSAQYAAHHGGNDPLTEELVAQRDQLRWISHTWSHAFLGCERNLGANSWQCATNEQGQTKWFDNKALTDEIGNNQTFMEKLGLKNYSTDELVTGEHSGLRKPPEQPEDHPHLATAVTENGIKWIASDASDESHTRPIGSATTVPRHPIDLDYNTATAEQAADQYNWLFTSREDGGSGQCEQDPNSPCVEPIDPKTGYADVIIPREAGEVFQHAITNDPRPHFVHQGNIASEGLLYPLLDRALADYRNVYADNTPLVNPTMTEAGEALVNQEQWARARDDVRVIVSGTRVKLENTSDRAVRVPFTGPLDSKLVNRLGMVTSDFGEEYAGSRSGWLEVDGKESRTLQLGADPGFAETGSWPVKHRPAINARASATIAPEPSVTPAPTTPQPSTPTSVPTPSAAPSTTAAAPTPAPAPTVPTQAPTVPPAPEPTDPPITNPPPPASTEPEVPPADPGSDPTEGGA